MKPESKMLATQRHRLIVERIRERGFATVPELAVECSVSEMTMRRDLDQLAERALISRTHGGAALIEGAGALMVDLVEPAFWARTEVNRAEKAAIGRMAASLIDDGQTVALDIGSTALELAHAVAGRAINVYTCSLKIATYLNCHTPNVYVPTGKIVGSEPSIVGAQTVQQIAQLNFDIVFIGVSGCSEGGFYDYSLEDSEIKRALITCSQKRVVLLDSSKFNRMSVVRVSDLAGVDALVTDAEPPKNLRKMFDAAGVDILIAK